MNAQIIFSGELDRELINDIRDALNGLADMWVYEGCRRETAHSVRLVRELAQQCLDQTHTD